MPGSRVAVDKARGAYLGQWAALRTWVGLLPDADWSRASAVASWSVGDLVAHLGLVADAVPVALAEPTGQRPMTVAEYLSAYPSAAASIDERTRDAGRASRAEVLAGLDTSAGRAEAALSAVSAGSDLVLVARRGPIRLSDLLVTRCIELTVHGDDLGRSIDRDDVPLRRPAMQLAVRSVAEVLAQRAPGHSVEVRVPPFAAVQCVAGPRHTRGTPPAVVETDPVTFLRMATGRVDWATAVAAGSVRLSGLRTDLSAYLPVLV